MKATFSTAVIAAFASLGLTSAAVDFKSIPRTSTAPIIPGAYIVELDPNAVAANGKRAASPHQELYASLHRRGVTWDLREEFDDDLFIGASVNIKSEADLLALASTEGVIAVQPVRLIPRPIVQKNHVLTGANDPELAAGDAQSVHIMTGVSKLHEQGIFGKGVKIGIIDSGVDWHHPNLGAGFGPGFKVTHGHDFVGDAYTGENAPIPDEDPDDCGGHGTHVAGTIAGNPGNEYNMSGVAYEATLGAYRVFGCDGSVSDEVLINAILRAYNDGNDVITMSLGGPAGWTESVSSVVSDRVAKAGRIVTIAAGNDGAMGAFDASGPASAIDAIAVGSVDNTVIPVQNAVASDREAPIPYYSLAALNFTEALPVYAISKELINNDGCEPLPDSTPDLSGFVVLIRRGTCALVDKLANAAAKGARVGLIYNNGGSPNAFSGGVIPGAMISTEDGAYLLEKFNAGTPTTITFPQSGGSDVIENPTGGLVSGFSSYGPTFDAHLKPSLSAPGGGIVSTVPLEQGGWALMSGTSMATPYVAGVSGLLLSVKGKTKEVAHSARDLFQTTANFIPASKSNEALLQTTSQQGAGLIDAFKALTYTTVVTPGQLLLNDTTHLQKTHKFTVQNKGAKSQSYTVYHVPAGTAGTVAAGSIQPNLHPLPLTADTARVDLSSTSFTLKAGETKSVTAKFTPPKADASTIPVYSGYIVVAGKELGEVLSVTYMGIGSELKKAKVLDNTDYLFGIPLPSAIDVEGNPVSQEVSYTFKGEDYPTFVYRLVFGTPALTFDLVDAAFDASKLPKRSVERRGIFDFLEGIWNHVWDHITGNTTRGQIKTIGNLVTYEWQPRHTESGDAGVGYAVFALSNNTFSDNTVIPNGRYKVLLRALKVTGDASKKQDYEYWASPVIGVKA